jgi:hypothetical protein
VIRTYSLSTGGTVRLFQHADGRLTFADKDPVRERAALEALLARRFRARETDEALHAAHMRLFRPREYDAPRPAVRDVLHQVRDDEEESWLAWQRFKAW